MLAAKEAHKQMLKKQKSKWHELLVDGSDSDEADYLNDETFDQLNINIKNLNFNAITNNYYSSSSTSTGAGAEESRIKKSHFPTSDSLNKRNTVSKRQRNELKTNNLRKSVAHMMKSNPNQSRIWNIDLAEDNSKSVYS